MRKSLSESPHTSSIPSSPGRHRPVAALLVVAAALSLLVAAAALADQVSFHGIRDHAVDIYAPHGVHPNGGLLYALLYGVTGLMALLWLAALGATRARNWLAPVVIGVVTAINSALGVGLLVAAEYDTRIYPPLWGILAVLPAGAGLTALVMAIRRL